MLWPVTFTKYQNTAAVWVSFKGELSEDGVYVSSTLSSVRPANDLTPTPYRSWWGSRRLATWMPRSFDSRCIIWALWFASSSDSPMDASSSDCQYPSSVEEARFNLPSPLSGEASDCPEPDVDT